MMRRMRETHSEEMRQYYQNFLSNRPCSACGGRRIRAEALGVKIAGKDITEVTALSVGAAFEFFDDLALKGAEAKIAAELLKEIRSRLRFLLNVGLGYLTLDRPAPSLSGGEGQRIRLASQIGSELTGVIYVLDEPSIGLHQRDNKQAPGGAQAPARHRQHGRRRRARPRGHGGGRLAHRLRPRRRAPRRRSGGRRHARRVMQEQVEPDRPVSVGRRAHRGARRAPARRRPDDHGRRRAREQPQGRRRRRSRWASSSASRACPARARARWSTRSSSPPSPAPCTSSDVTVGAHDEDQGPRPDRQGHRHRPEPDRPHAAQQPGHVHQGVRPHPRFLRAAARGADARLHARAASRST